MKRSTLLGVSHKFTFLHLNGVCSENSRGKKDSRIFKEL